MTICKCGARLQKLNTETGRAYLCTGCGRHESAERYCKRQKNSEGRPVSGFTTEKQEIFTEDLVRANQC